MANWVGPTVAIAVAVIALCSLALAAMALIAARRAWQATDTMTKELAQLRDDIAPALNGLNRLGTTGADLIERIESEVDKVIDTSKSIREEVVRGVRHTRNRLADLDALLEVATDEAEAALIDAAAAVESFRTTAGLLGHVGRLLQPRDDRQDYEEDEEDADEEVDEEGDESVDEADDELLDQNEEEVAG